MCKKSCRVTCSLLSIMCRMSMSLNYCLIQYRIIEKASIGGSEMSNAKLTIEDISLIVKPLADKYKIHEVYLFGSYARNEATGESDLDFLVYGGDNFRLTLIFAFAEELRRALDKNVDVFEINEVNKESDFYKNIMREKVLVA